MKSKQGDVTAAFLHADLSPEEKIFVEMPLGFRQKGKILCLKKTLCGLRQSPEKFRKYLTRTMTGCDVVASGFDLCMFVGERAIAVAFVGGIFF